MSRWPRLATLFFCALLFSGVAACDTPPAEPAASSETERYGRTTPSRAGIGKTYMGREIAHYMSHRGAGWLERADRVITERPDEVVERLGLQPDDVVADIGAGSGYFSRRMARQVPEGEVLAVDIQQEMLDILVAEAEREGITNIVPVLGTIEDPGLPAGEVDVVLMVDAYHEFSHPWEMMMGIKRSLKPGGRVVLVEYRAEQPEVPILRLHKMSEAQVRKELEAAGLAWKETLDFLPQQHFMVFEKAN